MSVEEMLRRVHESGPGWASRAFEADSSGAIATTTAAELRAIGLHRSLQPRRFGGEQDSIETHMRLTAAVGEYCVASAWCASVWSAHNWMVSLFSEEGQAEAWADPTTLISASIVPKSNLATDGDDVLVQGRFSFASGCDHAGWLGIGGIAQWGDEPTPVICLLPAEQVVIDHDSWDVAGLVGTGSKDLVVDEPVCVPAQRVLRTPQAVTRTAPGQLADDRALYRTPFRATAAIVLAGPVIGAAKAAVARFTQRLDSHHFVASRSSQRSDPAAALRLAESAADVNAAELVLLEAARRLDQLGTQDEPDPVAVAAVVRDTAYGVRLGAKAVDRLYEASGGTALQKTEPMQRYWRDVHAARSHAVLTWDAAAMAYGRAAAQIS